jgi:hypothetical protein
LADGTSRVRFLATRRHEAKEFGMYLSGVWDGTENFGQRILGSGTFKIHKKYKYALNTFQSVLKQTCAIIASRISL